MRRVIAGMIAAGMVVGYAGFATAADKDAKKKKVVEAPKLSDQQRTQFAEQSVRTLNSQPWKIYIFPQGGVAGTVETDILTFSGTSVVSENLKAKGFSGSNYSLTVQDDGSATWETVQRDAKNDFAMWRGDLRGDGLQGIVNMRTAAGVSVNREFSTLMPKLSPAQSKPATESQMTAATTTTISSSQAQSASGEQHSQQGKAKW